MPRKRSQLAKVYLQHEAVRNLMWLIKKANYKLTINEGELDHWSYGWFSSAERRVHVNLRRPDGRFWSLPDFIFIMAHEYRHIQHHKFKLFKKYYADYKHPKPKYFLTGLAAEMDCDKFAKAYVLKYSDELKTNKSVLLNRKYPSWRVAPRVLPEKLLEKRREMNAPYIYKKLFSANWRKIAKLDKKITKKKLDNSEQLHILSIGAIGGKK